MLKLDIPQILRSLAQCRPVFHSEADFQHELAWILREEYPELQPRLEYPFEGPKNASCDIMLLQNGAVAMALELKYFTKAFEGEVRGEQFNLRDQLAHDTRSYDTLKDITRMENFLEKHPKKRAAVIALTNDPRYWKGPEGKKKNPGEEVIYAEFVLQEGKELTGLRGWAPEASEGTKKGREEPIHLRDCYTMRWQDYSHIEGQKHGLFRFLHIPVQAPSRPSPA